MLYFELQGSDFELNMKSHTIIIIIIIIIIDLHESSAPLWGIVSLVQFLDLVQLWNCLDDRPIEPMDIVVFCMFEKMASIARYFVIFSIPMAG